VYCGGVDRALADPAHRLQRALKAGVSMLSRWWAESSADVDPRAELVLSQSLPEAARLDRGNAR